MQASKTGQLDLTLEHAYFSYTKIMSMYDYSVISNIAFSILSPVVEINPPLM